MNDLKREATITIENWTPNDATCLTNNISKLESRLMLTQSHLVRCKYRNMFARKSSDLVRNNLKTKDFNNIGMKIRKKYYKKEPLFSCKKCPKKIRQSNTFSNYARSQLEKGFFKCDKCEKMFTKKKNLQSHQIVHLNDRSFACSQCDKKFKTAWGVKSHFRVHSREKPYKCLQCEERFSYYIQLARHSRIHLGESKRKYVKKFKTKLISPNLNSNNCEMTTIGELNLNSSCQSQLEGFSRANFEGDCFKCNKCEMRFKILSNCVIHLRLHSFERPFICIKCRQKFQFSSELAQHVKIHNFQNI